MCEILTLVQESLNKQERYNRNIVLLEDKQISVRKRKYKQ